ncbi:hypothetical protein AcV7_007615 [Taiwanofungus camphoratus]|nr:hypothetical protein AcV7_007615 [Antrodia cinnamomea]
MTRAGGPSACGTQVVRVPIEQEKCTICILVTRKAQVRRVTHEHPQSIGMQSHLELLTVIYFAEETEEVTRSVSSSSFQFDCWASKAVPEYHQNRSFSEPR